MLTDGSLPYQDGRQQGKSFLAQDGAMIKLAQSQGLEVGIISGRESLDVAQRAQELGISCCRLGIVDKLSELNNLCRSQKWDMQQIAYIGDDVPDIAICQAVGLG